MKGIRRAIKISLLALGLCSSAAKTSAQNIIDTTGRPDTGMCAEIQQQLQHNRRLLYYPNSVARFYEAKSFQPAWIKGRKNPKQTREAMLMIDCVLQFGLSHNDYHPTELLYDKLQTMVNTPDVVGSSQKACFDIMLTDALLAFMNNLHYGKLNPGYTSQKIDEGKTSFKAEEALTAFIKAADFMSAVLSVQPKSKEYTDLQDHMRLLAGQRLDDCYEIPEGDVRKMAINMERLRWAAMEEPVYIHINIPSYTLKFHHYDTITQFKVVVGKPANPTPTLYSNINYFTTAPEWKVPKRIFVKEVLPKALKDPAYLDKNNMVIYDSKGKYVYTNAATLRMISQNPQGYSARQSSGCDNALGLIVFRFPNVYDIFLHDTPEQKLFKQDQRAFSHGCIRVEQAEKVAELMLKNDGSESLIPSMHKAVLAYQTKNFSLKKPLPIKVTYLTCEMQEGILVNYKDIYNVDKSLEMALYQTNQGVAEIK